jgi:two-component system, NtrC family, sensor kinase
MADKTRLEDLIGLEDTKLGFFREVQEKIRELKAANIKLEQERQKIQAVLDGISDVLAVVSPDFRILSVNPVFHRIYGDNNPEGRRCYRVFRGREVPCDPCPLKEARDNDCVSRQGAIYPVSGQNRQFEITASPIHDPDGALYGVLLLKRDVTLEKQYQANYYHAEKMATVGLLAAGVAHEINNPLTAIGGFAEGLDRRIPKLAARLGNEEADRELLDDVNEYVETIRNECRRCRDIVGSLLTFSPRRRAEFTSVDINRIIHGVLRLLHHQLKRYPPDLIRLDLDPDLDPARGVDAELRQVVLNLVLNALDAVEPTEGIITLQTRRIDDDRIRLSVIDTGCGIDPENLDKLFEPFFTTKPVGKGIGIGLATCCNIIKQHEGEITADIRKGYGAVFTVTLPIHMP